MTTSRGQNVSILPRSDTDSITVFTDTGGSLRRASQKISLRADKSKFRNKKSFGQHSSKNFLLSAFGTYQNRDCNTIITKCSNALITNSVSSTSLLNSVNRELSPVRWCDREVDGVYLGRSGWVQVQQRSSDDCKDVPYSENIGFCTLTSQKKFSELSPDHRFKEKRECNRPLNLSLPMKKRTVRDNYEESSKFTQEFQSMSPPSITPIISPPPAFKDDGLDSEFSRQSIRELPFCRKSFPQRFETNADPEIFQSSLLGRRNVLNSSSSISRTESISSSTSKNQNSPLQVLHTKSFEDDHSHKMWRNRRLNSASCFRSFDNGIRITNKQKFSESDSFRGSFGSPGTDCEKEKEGIKNEEIEEMKKAFSQLNHQGNGKKIRRRNFAENSRNSYRARSCSLDSNGSSSNDSSSSKSSSNRGSNINYKNFEKTILRKIDSKQNQQSKFGNSLSKNCRHFNVKRSRSLQLCEKKSANESVFLDNSFSENSRNPALFENSTFRFKNQNNESFPQCSPNHVFVTVNGECIPVVASSSQSPRSLNKITKSTAEQKKLIMEAEKEAKIISEYMNGTRSREAARNLLMHRYFNRPEDENSIVLAERYNPQKNEHDSHFPVTTQNPSNKQNCLNKTYFNKGSFCKKNQFNSFIPNLEQYSISSFSTPLTSVFSNSSQASYQSRNFRSFHNCLNQRKVEQIENKEKEKSHLVYLEQASDNHSKCKKRNTSFPVDWISLNPKTQEKRLAFFSDQKRKLNDFERPNTEKFKSKLTDMKFKSMSNSAEQSLSVKTVSEIEKRNFGSNTFEENFLISSSSSSSSDICMNDFGTKFKKTNKVMESSAVFKNFVQDSDSKTLPERFHSRPGSAPESDGCISKGIDKRSLSLPRSFLSERYRLNNSYQRNLLPLKQGPPEIPTEILGECCLNLQGSHTAPTTPVRDFRYGKSTESLYQIPSYRSSCASLFGETFFSKSRRIIQENAPRTSEQSTESSNEIKTYCVDKKPLKISDSSSETILQKLKKNFSIKYLKRKEYLQDSTETINHENKGENTETLCVANSLTFSLQAFENGLGNISEQANGFVRQKNFEKRVFKNEKYDSRDSGIQIINRGIIDSSESQDTDILEDADSPLMVRRYKICSKDNICKPKSEVIDNILTDKFKIDLQRRIKIKKHTNGKLVKRCFSDLGDNRSLNRGVKRYGERLNFYSSLVRDSDSKISWRTPSPDVSTALNRFEKLLKPLLRRSLSEPLGLNDLLSFKRRRPSILKAFELRESEKNPSQRKSESELLYDSESSVSSLCDRKKSFDSTPREESTVLAEAVWDHVTIESGELPFRAGDVIEVLDTRDRDWWWGTVKESKGYFPSAFVRLRVSQENTVEDCLAEMTKDKNTSKQLRRGKSVSFLSNDQVRSKIIKELLNTERDFVKILHDVKDGYVSQCKQRTDMFTPTQITTIFSNLEDLLVFQNKFLDDLEANIDREYPFKSCIGEVFLNHGLSFQMYSEYCNSHPMAIATLQDLYQKYNYCKFFEMCRLKQSLIEIPLDGYLLTPVQRICKYPLQLGELLKYTKPDHPDYKNVQKALETMRSVATLINERKRKMESLEKLAAWQLKVEGWEGEDLIEISSQLIHQGDVVKITSGMRTTNITLFLFDHQIIYCKKDLLKKNVYIYKDRILLDGSDVTDIPDGKCQQLGVTIKYGLKINNNLKDKWLVFCCRSNEDKLKWLEVLAEEKKLVAQDKERNLDLPPAAKQLAKMAVRTNKYPPCKLKVKNKFAFNRDTLLCTESQSGISKSKSNKRIGKWFPFGEMMKNTKYSLKSQDSIHRFT